MLPDTVLCLRVATEFASISRPPPLLAVLLEIWEKLKVVSVPAAAKTPPPAVDAILPEMVMFASITGVTPAPDTSRERAPPSPVVDEMAKLSVKLLLAMANFGLLVSKNAPPSTTPASECALFPVNKLLSIVSPAPEA